ncbi:hypothetical protein LRX75_15455 [Rhizobium sp. DKSPLA3]|uniref:Uncharacterized protein n=1 Tax=Rhizobium quercicola TaxID=2901226 RepID=A0A9X1NU64_9HYPH|nr:hypothetical protein [Rhizobium quercicola]MCD7110435.1 hypothetical protein [Rhizobium quercicola]
MGDAVDFRKQWDQWGWLLPALVIVVVFFRLLYGREAFCGSASEQCFREWVSALGGWAAVIAAIPTVYFLSKQIQSTADHARVNFRVNVRSNVNLAEAAIQSSIEIRFQIKEMRGKFDHASMPRTTQISVTKSVLVMIAEAIRRPVFSEFEAKIGLPDKITITTLTIYFDGQVTALERMMEVADLFPVEQFEAELHGSKRAIDYAENYAQSISEKASAYVADIERLGSLIR